MKRFTFIPLAVLLPLAAQAGFSANLAVTTDYVWRGVSQTLGDPALQGGLDFEHDSGVYAGVWASKVDFFDGGDPEADPADDDGADVEIDYYAGFAGETENGLGWDIGIVSYTFPDSDLDSSEEVYLGLSYNMFSAQVSQDFGSDSTYVEAAAEIALPKEFVFTVHASLFSFEDDIDYLDFKLALGKTFGGFDFELAYTDTDLSDTECADADFAGFEDVCDGTVTLTVTKVLEF